jgi:hypothetical protein
MLVNLWASWDIQHTWYMLRYCIVYIHLIWHHFIFGLDMEDLVGGSPGCLSQVCEARIACRRPRRWNSCSDPTRCADIYGVKWFVTLLILLESSRYLICFLASWYTIPPLCIASCSSTCMCLPSDFHACRAWLDFNFYFGWCELHWDGWIIIKFAISNDNMKVL